jgi:DNA polymerase III delta prime subunit
MSNFPYGFSKVLGHESELAFLKNLILKDRIPSGLIFYGQESIGKKFTAFSFASSVLCLNLNLDLNFNNGNSKKLIDSKDRNINPNGHLNNFSSALFEPCGECSSCTGILNKTNSNIIYIEHEKGLINIDKINGLARSLSLLPANNAHRFVIIDESSKMNVGAMNSILKILEEPPEKTVFILIAANLNSILPTIISRCMLVNFKPINEEILFDYAKNFYNDNKNRNANNNDDDDIKNIENTANNKNSKKKGFNNDDDILTMYVRLARGSISNLVNLMSGNYIKLRNEIFDIFISESFNKKLLFYNYNMSEKFNNIIKNYKESGGKSNKSDNKTGIKTRNKNIVQSDNAQEALLQNNYKNKSNYLPSINTAHSTEPTLNMNLYTNVLDIDESYIFEIILVILRDILVYLVTKNIKLIYNVDIYEEIKKIAVLDNFDEEKISEMIEITLSHINNLNYNLNKHISLDRYFSAI